MKSIYTKLCVILMSCVIFGCGKQADAKDFPIPEVYGVYVIDNGKLIRVDKGESLEQPVSPDISFLIFDRALRNGLVSGTDIMQLRKRQAVRYDVEIRKKNAQNNDEEITVKDAKGYIESEKVFTFESQPINKQDEMLRLIPRTSLPNGLYTVCIGKRKYDLSVKVTEEEGKKINQVDRYYTTIGSNSGFSWSNFAASTFENKYQGQTYNGNTVINIELKPTKDFDELAESWKKQARSACDSGDIPKAIKIAKIYSQHSFDDSLFSKIAESIDKIARYYLDNGRKFEALALFKYCPRDGMSEENSSKLDQMLESIHKDVIAWNTSAQLRQPVQEKDALTVHKILWKPNRNALFVVPVIGSSIGTNDFVITDIGITGKFSKENRQLLFKDMGSIKKNKVRIPGKNFGDSRLVDGITLDTHGSYKIGFSSPNLRDSVYSILFDAKNAWFPNTNFGLIQIKVSKNRISYIIEASSDGWTEPIMFPLGWSLVNYQRSGYNAACYDKGIDKQWNRFSTKLPLTASGPFRFLAQKGKSRIQLDFSLVNWKNAVPKPE